MKEEIARVLEQIHDPVPAIGRLDHHRRRVARRRDRRGELERIVRNPGHRQPLTRLILERRDGKAVRGQAKVPRPAFERLKTNPAFRGECRGRR